jgi:ComF family protein
MQVTADPYCPRCGMTYRPHEIRLPQCTQCQQRRPAIDEFVRVGRYQGVLADLIRRYKFSRQQHLDATLARLLAEAISGRAWQDELDGLIPVPGDWRACWRYRFNPVGLVAAEVGKRLKVPVYHALGVRGKKKRQTELAESQRRENVRGIYHIKKSARFEGAKVCIVDDVSTTGSTLQVLARLLKDAGAEKVYAAALAKTGENERSWGA